MPGYFGPLGMLTALNGVSELSRSGGVAHTSATSVTGRTVNVQRIATRRSWSLSAGAVSPETAAAVEALSYGAFGAGPFYYVPVDAPGANVITPWDSITGQALRLASPLPSGWASTTAQVMPDGTLVPGGLLRSTSTTVALLTAAAIPLNPAGSTTISAYVQGSAATLSVRFTDASGAGSSSWYPTTATSGGGIERVSITVSPTGSYGLLVAANTPVTWVGGLQVTWTDHVVPYAVGRGCSSAVLGEVTDDTIVAIQDSIGWGRLSKQTWKITEVG